MRLRWHRHRCTAEECDKTYTHADPKCVLPEAHACNYHNGYTALADVHYQPYSFNSNNTKGHSERRTKAIKKANTLRGAKVKR
jgi:hypothetical protein